MTQRTIKAFERWPGVARLYYGFDRAINESVKRGHFRFDGNCEAADSKAWYVPVGELDRIQADTGIEVVYQSADELDYMDSQCTHLMPHQRECVERALRERALLVQIGTGLGKSLIGLEIADVVYGGALIIAFQHVIPEWIAEAEKHGYPKPAIIGDKKFDPNAKIWIVSWGSLHKIPEDAKFSTLIYDEVQAALNAESARSKHVHRLSMRNHWAVRVGLSATPLGANTHAIWDVLSALCPWRFGTKYQWTERFHEITEGYNKCRLVGKLREDRKAEWVKVVGDISYTLTHADVPYLLPDVVWRAQEIGKPSGATAPQTLSTWRDEMSLCRGERIAAVADLVSNEEFVGPVAFITYFVESAEKLAEALNAPHITGKMVPKKRRQIALEAPIIVASMQSIATGLNLQRFHDIRIVEVYPVPSTMTQVCGRFARVGGEGTYTYTLYQMAGTSDEVVAAKLADRMNEQQARAKNGQLQQGLLDVLCGADEEIDFLALIAQHGYNEVTDDDLEISEEF